MAKRQRISTAPWWNEIVSEVTLNGGYIYRGVTFLPNSRSIVSDVEIPSKTLVFRIPKTSIIHSELAGEYAWIRELEAQSDGENLYSPITDIMLAYKLASEDPTYLKTLPPSSAWNSLPRRWTEESIKKYLGGSPLMERVKQQKSGVAADYDRLCEHENGKDAPAFPKFDDMLAAVTSRAFAGWDEEIMMIPIVDLCNHSRGMEKKNLEYKILGDGTVEVHTIAEIEQYESFRLTYGAKGNGQLLLNYGFALKDNLESDGSSNDFLEFSCDGTTVVELKTGPKDYTYGKFIKILEQTRNHSTSSIQDDQEDMDMNEFLDGADDMEDMDIYGAASNDGIPDDEQEGEMVESELEALQSLKRIIRERTNAYSCRGSKLLERLSSQEGSIELFSALHILSEHRCLYFYFIAAQKVEGLLLKQDLNKLEQADDFKDLPMHDEDRLLIDKQTTELANIFMEIRHGSILF